MATVPGPAVKPTKWRVSMTWDPGTVTPPTPDHPNGTTFPKQPSKTVIIELFAFNANDMLNRAKLHAGQLENWGSPITWGTPVPGWIYAD